LNRRKAIKTLSAGAIILATTNANANPKSVENKKSSFNRIKMSPKDVKSLTKGEKKHTPEITIKDKDSKGFTLIEINVGSGGIIHPSTKSHWIDFIELYADNNLVGRTELEGEISRGFSSFSVNLKNIKSLKAVSGCNLHGIWETTHTM